MIEIDIEKLEALPVEMQNTVVDDLEALHAEKCKDSYFEFFKKAWTIIEPNTPLKLSPHIPIICAILENQVKRMLENGQADYDTIILNIPPSMSKSTLCTKIFPAWVWLLMPHCRFANASYSGDLAVEHSGKTRDIVQSEWYKKHYSHICYIRQGENRKREYWNSEQGSRLATSVRGTITGKHAHILVADDLIKPSEIDSEIARKQAQLFWTKTLTNRILEGGFKILVMQRLHMKDPTGLQLQSEERTFHICLPAEISNIVKPEYLKGIYSDGLLDPARLPADRLKVLEAQHGSTEYSCQYKQNPIPAGGRIIKESGFKYIDDIFVPKDLIVDLWVDGAYTENTANDATGILPTAYDKTRKRLYILNFLHVHMELPEFLRSIKEWHELFGLTDLSRIMIEPKASGKSMKQMIADMYPYINAIEIKNKLVNGGKRARANIMIPKYEAGQIIHVNGNWTKKFEAQLTGFPSYGEDEAIDCGGYAAYDYFFKPQWSGDDE